MEIEIGRLWHAVRKYWMVGVSAIIVLAILAGVLSTAFSEKYTATSTLLVVPVQSDEGKVVDTGTYLSLAKSGPVLDRVILELGLDIEREDLVGKLVVTQVPGTQIIEISSTDSDPELAAEITNATARSFVAQVDELTQGTLQANMESLEFESSSLEGQITTLDQQLAEFQGERSSLSSEDQVRYDELSASRLDLSQTKADVDSSIRIVRKQIATAQPVVAVNETAVPPDQPDNISPVIMSVVGGSLGAVIGGMLMLLLEYRRSGIRDVDHLNLVTDARVLGDVSSDCVHDAQLRILGSRIAGRARLGDIDSIILISADADPADQEFTESLFARSELQGLKTSESLNIFSNADPLSVNANRTGAVMIVGSGRTTENQVKEMDTLLADLGITNLGVILT